MSKTEEKQKLFIKYYISYKFNGRKAYKKLHPNASKETCDVNASRLLSSAKVQKMLQEQVSKVSKKATKTANDVLREIESLAFHNLNKITEKIRNEKELTEEEQKTIFQDETIYTRDDTRRKIKGYDKLKALELLGKYHGLFTDRLVTETANDFNKRLNKIKDNLSHNKDLAEKIEDELLDE